MQRRPRGEHPDLPQTGSSAVGVAGPGRPSRLRGKHCGTASVGIKGRLGAVMSASIQPRRERSPVVITSRSSGSSRKGGRGRAARWRRLAAWRSRCAPSGWYQVRRSRRRVDRGAGRPGRAWEEVRGGVVDVVGDETGAACGRGPAARFSSRNGTRRWCRPRLGRIRAQGARRARRLAQGRSV
jgi:hypothetical protein